ncbi:hypothetical protein SAMD00079811_23750 [Scytonema sp. HK-05]|nr:hypothetical protein SAMD00079811_23750 [Scytonema sp. HK-05]
MSSTPSAFFQGILLKCFYIYLSIIPFTFCPLVVKYWGFDPSSIIALKVLYSQDLWIFLPLLNVLLL